MVSPILPMLAVDNDIEVSLREQTEWLNHGIPTVRVDAMQEAIEKLTKESFLFTSINADSVNYLPLLPIMRDTAPTFIFIIDSNYTVEKEVEALHKGADVYTQFNENVELNVQLALAQLLRCKDRDKQPAMPAGMVIYKNFLVSTFFRLAFYNDAEIKLSRLEFDLLNYFISNPGRLLSYKEINLGIWGAEYRDLSHKSLWNHVFSLRKKLKNATGFEHIETERNAGYRFVIK